MANNRKEILNLCFGVIGVVGLIFSIYTYERTKLNGLLIYHVVQRLVYKPVKIDELNEIIKLEKTGSASSIFLSEITIWNAGNISFEQKDNRIPVRLLGDQSFNVVGYKIINSKSIVTDNFSAEIYRKSLKIDWKIFDPGEAVKIAIVHNGNPNSISVVGNFGPGRSIEQSGPVLILQIASFFLFSSPVILS